MERPWATAEVGNLAAAIGALVTAPVTDDIEQVLWLRDRLDAYISRALRDLDRDQRWRADGSLSLTAWLAAHAKRAHKDSYREAVVARRLALLPLTAAAWADGTLSSGQVLAVVANVSAERAPLYATQEPELTPSLSELSVRGTSAAMRAWRLHAEATEDGPAPPEHPTELWLSPALDGRKVVQGHFRPEDAAVVEEALGTAAAKLRGSQQSMGEGPHPSAAERRGEALVGLCRWFLRNYTDSSGSRPRPHVAVVVGLSELAGGLPGRLADGTPVGARTVERLSCDSELHRIVMAGRSTVLDYGASTRTISPALWAALVVRDVHCRHPGCDCPPSWCEGHHVVHFAQGGPTRLSNLVLACTRHHHLWHEEKWDLSLGPDATLSLTSPVGASFTSRPPPRLLVA